MADTVEGALSGIRVLDLGCGITAPHCAKMLGDYGADVIKVEPPQGDPARRYGPFPHDEPHPEKGGLFLHLNTNKRGVTLDLTTRTGASLCRGLAAWADVLVENHAPGYLASLGLGYDSLKALNPRLVMTSITPFGQWGPHSGWQATEMVAFAMTSRLFAHGQPDREPLRYAPDVVSFQAAVTAATATLGALWWAQDGGQGQWVDVSMQEAMINNVDSRTLITTYSGRSIGRRDRIAGGGYPSGVYPCGDGFMLFAAGGDRFFRRLCRAMGRPELLQDPRWATPDVRAPHKDEFEAEFLVWLVERDRAEVFRVCQAEGVMCAPILTTDEVFRDPQLVAREYFQQVVHPVAGEVLLPGPPFRMAETPWRVARPAPQLGEHNLEVYGELLGIDREDLVRLRATGVV
ncbi:MAG: CoA transferase [Chloroflexi bacterium]|nr:CoA transferase [Chloroflexota bacterium]